MNRRSKLLVLQAPKNIHHSVRVNDFPLAETLVRGIDRMHWFIPGHDRHLIIESFCSAKISLSKVRKDVILNILAVQRDYDPIDGAAVRTKVTGGRSHLVRDRTHQRRDARFKLPTR